MRKPLTLWQRCLGRHWPRKLTIISLAIASGSACFIDSASMAAPKKPAKPARGVEKVARKNDDTDSKTKELAKEVPAEVPENHPLKPCIKAAEESLAAMKPIKDYTTKLFKTEVVGGKTYEQVLQMKLRHEPFSVYLKFETLHAGREVIYVEGQNKGKLLAHETGFKALAGTFSYLPTDKQVLVDNRYPITQAGMSRLLEAVIAQWKAEAKYQEVKVQSYSDAQSGDVLCRLLEVVHPQPREHFKFHKTQLYLDAKTKLPIRFAQFGWPEAEGGEPVLLEEYIYTEVDTNVGLTDFDFDKTNKQYDF